MAYQKSKNITWLDFNRIDDVERWNNTKSIIKELRIVKGNFAIAKEKGMIVEAGVTEHSQKVTAEK